MKNNTHPALGLEKVVNRPEPQSEGEIGDDMPDEVWAYEDNSEGYGGHWFNSPAPVDDGNDTVKYTRTQAIVDLLEGMRLTNVNPLFEPAGNNTDTVIYNKTLDDAIKAIKDME